MNKKTEQMLGFFIHLFKTIGFKGFVAQRFKK